MNLVKYDEFDHIVEPSADCDDETQAYMHTEESDMLLNRQVLFKSRTEVAFKNMRAWRKRFTFKWIKNTIFKEIVEEAEKMLHLHEIKNISHGEFSADLTNLKSQFNSSRIVNEWQTKAINLVYPFRYLVKNYENCKEILQQKLNKELRSFELPITVTRINKDFVIFFHFL